MKENAAGTRQKKRFMSNNSNTTGTEHASPHSAIRLIFRFKTPLYTMQSDVLILQFWTFFNDTDKNIPMGSFSITKGNAAEGWNAPGDILAPKRHE